MDDKKPDILFIMCDQMRFDCISGHGNPHIYTPNLDRLARRGISFSNAYSSCPVCVPARYNIRTGRESTSMGFYHNGISHEMKDGKVISPEEKCGKYLARVMKESGYRTFGIGKFHTSPTYEDLGYDIHLHSEELYGTPEIRNRDAYVSFLANEHPEYNWLETLHGERTEMYYMPQMSPMPAELTVEAWAADRAIDEIRKDDGKPYFGFVSFVGPHPPFAPPVPFNRMYDPDKMPDPILGDISIDHMDEQIPNMNYMIWAEDINLSHARVLKARYYDEITYIDQCIGRILDAVDERPNADNTLICFFSDHGDHLGDHHAWQKESFFEESCHIPFLVSLPNRYKGGTTRNELVSLTDLFGIATSAAGNPDFRDGIDLLGAISRNAELRDYLFGYYGDPGTPQFKAMIRHGDYKYIYMANGGRSQLFDIANDPREFNNISDSSKQIAEHLHKKIYKKLAAAGIEKALCDGDIKSFPFTARPLGRIYQFDHSKGVTGFPEKPEDLLK